MVFEEMLMITPEEIKQIRVNLNLTQSKFCNTFGVPLRALQEWEQKNCIPSPTSTLLLMVIKINQDVVIEVTKKNAAKNIKKPVITPEEIKQIRVNLNLTQSKFCNTFGVPLRALQKWEQGNRIPSPTGELLLRVIEINPDVVIAASKKVMDKHK